MARVRDARFDMRMPADIVDAVKRLAADDERPVSQYVERVLRQHVERERKEKRK